MILCDLKVVLNLKKNLYFHIISIQRNSYRNWLINECARKNLAKRALCDLLLGQGQTYFYEKFV